jgi:hypothetical protein
MGARAAVLGPTDGKGGRNEVDLIPTEVASLRDPQAMPESNQDHGRVPVPPAIALRGRNQAVYFRGGQVLPCPQIGVRSAQRVTVRFTVLGVTSLRGDRAIKIPLCH